MDPRRGPEEWRQGRRGAQGGEHAGLQRPFRIKGHGGSPARMAEEIGDEREPRRPRQSQVDQGLVIIEVGRRSGLSIGISAVNTATSPHFGACLKP